MSLLAASLQGLGWSLALLILLFLAVHGCKLALLGLRSLKKPPPEEKPKPETEQVYFLVERKKKRQRPDYSEPKRIDFK